MAQKTEDEVFNEALEAMYVATYEILRKTDKLSAPDMMDLVDRIAGVKGGLRRKVEARSS